MNRSLKTPGRLTKVQLFIAGFIAVLFCFVPANADDKDTEMLNRLYREIIGSAPAGISFIGESQRPAGCDVAPAPSPAGDSLLPVPSGSGTIADPASEQLRSEIEKIVREAETRHSETIKFMQDTR
jgi:hypothetical protein